MCEPPTKKQKISESLSTCINTKLRSYGKWGRKLIIKDKEKIIESTQILLRPASKLLELTNTEQTSKLNVAINGGSGGGSNKKPLSKKESEDRVKNLDLVFIAMEQLAKMGFLLTPEQSIIIKAMISAQVPKILGDQMVIHLGMLMKKYGMTSFRKILAVRFGRRRGKSKAVGYFHAIMMATQPRFYGMIFNLDQDLAQQNLKYAAEFIQMLENDPDHRINCKILHLGKNTLDVKSHHGTDNQLFSAPDISRLKGKVSRYNNNKKINSSDIGWGKFFSLI